MKHIYNLKSEEVMDMSRVDSDEQQQEMEVMEMATLVVKGGDEKLIGDFIVSKGLLEYFTDQIRAIGASLTCCCPSLAGRIG